MAREALKWIDKPSIDEPNSHISKIPGSSSQELAVATTAPSSDPRTTAAVLAVQPYTGVLTGNVETMIRRREEARSTMQEHLAKAAALANVISQLDFHIAAAETFAVIGADTLTGVRA